MASITMWYCPACGGSWPPTVLVCPRDGTLGRPERIGPFRLELRIGAGGYAEVYRAVDERDESKVALKLFFQGLDLTSLLPDVSLVHPHLAVPLEAGTREDGRSFLVCELAEGVPLRRYVERGALDAPAAVAIALQVARGLEFLQEHSLLHGDLKPDNIVIERDAEGAPHTRLIDIGFVFFVEQVLQPEDGDPDSSPLHFTPDYMAPEVIRTGKRTAATEVYALGCSLYEMLTGKTPYTGPTVFERVRRHLEDPVPPLPRTPTGAAHPLEEIVVRCIAKAPLERPPLAALIEMLEAARRQLGPPELPVLPTVEVSAASSTHAFAELAHAAGGNGWANGERSVPTEEEIASRLVLANPHDPLCARQMASTLRQAVGCLRELDRLVSDAPSIDLAAARDLLRALALSSEQLQLWLNRNGLANR